MVVVIEKSDTMAIHVAKTEFKGKEYVDIRNFYQDKDTGEWMPTKKGIAIPVDLVDEVMEAVEEVQGE